MAAYFQDTYRPSSLWMFQGGVRATYFGDGQHVRLEPRFSFLEVRRAALAFGREVERRRPELVTTQWWKEDRHGVFID